MYNLNWQLLYDDELNIYLITSDYVRVNALPNQLQKESEDSDSSKKYKAWFTIVDYNANTGPIMVQDENDPSKIWYQGSDANSLSTNNYIINTYLKWVGSSLNTDGTNNTTDTRTNPNIKATAFMMDTNVWDYFAGGVTGAHGYGGPTLEMFEKSYNAAHSTKIEEHNTINDVNSNNSGYKVAWAVQSPNTPSWGNNITGLTNPTGKNMWILNNNNKADGFWISSPSSINNGLLNAVSRNGYLSNYRSIWSFLWLSSCSFYTKIIFKIKNK